MVRRYASECLTATTVLLILALAYWLLVGIGWVARQTLPPAMWCSSNRQKECSGFTIGRIMIGELQVTGAMAFGAGAAAIAETTGKWG